MLLVSVIFQIFFKIMNFRQNYEFFFKFCGIRGEQDNFQKTYALTKNLTKNFTKKVTKNVNKNITKNVTKIVTKNITKKYNLVNYILLDVFNLDELLFLD